MNWAFASCSARADASAPVPDSSYPHRKLRHQQLPRWIAARGSLVKIDGAVRGFFGHHYSDSSVALKFPFAPTIPPSRRS